MLLLSRRPRSLNPRITAERPATYAVRAYTAARGPVIIPTGIPIAKPLAASSMMSRILVGMWTCTSSSAAMAAMAMNGASESGSFST